MARNDSTRTKQLSANLRSALVTAALVGTLGGWVAFGSQQAATTATDTTAAVAVVQVATRSGEFSLGKPGRETLYTRVDREARYKAKAFIDTAIYRGGDLTYVWLHKWLATFGSRMVFVAGIGIAIAMSLGAWQVIRAQRRLPD